MVQAMRVFDCELIVQIICPLFTAVFNVFFSKTFVGFSPKTEMEIVVDSFMST